MGKFEGCLLLSDMDGTFLDENSNVHPKNLKAARYFMDEGGKFAVATGRPKQNSMDLIAEIKPNSPCLFCNGGEIYDFQNDKIIHLEILKPRAKDDLKTILNEYYEVGVNIVTPEKIYILKNKPNVNWTYPEQYKKSYEKADIEDVAEHWIKIIFIASPDVLESLEKYVRLYFPHYSFIRSSKHFLEMVPKGTSKGNSLLYLSEHLNIPLSKTFAIGDYNNDITMIKIAEIGALANNAPNNIKHYADIIVDNNKDGAVADFINILSNK